MSNASQRLVRFGALLAFILVVVFAVYQRSDGAAVFASFVPVLIIGIPVSGLACLVAALVSRRVRHSISVHPILYIAWAVAGIVVICLVVSAVVTTAKLRYGH